MVDGLHLELSRAGNAPVFPATHHDGAAPRRKDDFIVGGVGARRILLRVCRTINGFVGEVGLWRLPTSGVCCVDPPSVVTGGAAGGAAGTLSMEECPVEGASGAIASGGRDSSSSSFPP